MQKRHPITHDFMRQFFILSAILFLGYIIFDSFIPYISGLFGAIILFVLTRNWMRKLTNLGFKRWLSASLLILFSMIVVLLPIGALIFMITYRIKEIINNSEKYVFLLETNIAALEDFIGLDISKEIENPKQLIGGFAQQISEGTLDIFVSIGILYFVLYFLLINYDVIKSKINDYVPLSQNNFNRISKESYEMVKSNAIAIPLVALMQGLVALFGFYIFNAPNPWFWFALTTIGSMIPFVGTAVGMIPIILIMYSQGQTFEAIALAFYGLLVVGLTDNLFRIIVQKRLAEIHPLITLIGVIVGIPLFGFLGLVFGPLLVSLFLLLLRIYKEEYFPQNTFLQSKEQLNNAFKNKN